MINCELDPQQRTEEYDDQGYVFGVSAYTFDFAGHSYDLEIFDTTAKLELQVTNVSTGNNT